MHRIQTLLVLFMSVPGGAVSDKYVMTYVDGQFIITNKTPQSISWGQDFSSAAINQIIDLNASASSSLPVTYVVSDTSKAELGGNASKQPRFMVEIG